MGNTQTIQDYNYGQIIVSQDKCIKSYPLIKGLEEELQSQNIPVLQFNHETPFICGGSTIQVIYEYHTFTLFSYLQEKESPLLENEVVQTTFKLIKNINPRKVQIHPKEILLPNYEFCDPELFLIKKDEHRIPTLLLEDKFIAPELLDLHYKPNEQTRLQAQIYSIGLVMLYMMTKKTPNQYENIDNLDLCNYSLILRHLITDMLAIDPSQRPGLEQIKERLEETIEFAKSRNLKHKTSPTILTQEIEIRKSEISYDYCETSTRRPLKILAQITNPPCKSSCQSPGNKSIALSFSNKSNNVYSFVQSKSKASTKVKTFKQKERWR